MDQMDGFVDAHTEEAADGVITRQEWRHYFDFVAEEDTNNPETSPACAKVLSALEYAEIYKGPAGTHDLVNHQTKTGASKHLHRALSSRKTATESREPSQQSAHVVVVHQRSRHRRPNPELRLLKNFLRPDEQLPPPRVPRKKVHFGSSESKPLSRSDGVRIVRRRHKRKKLHRQHQGLLWGPSNGSNQLGSTSGGGGRGQVAI